MVSLDFDYIVWLDNEVRDPPVKYWLQGDKTESLQRQNVANSFVLPLSLIFFIHQLGREEIDVNEVISKVPFHYTVLLFFIWLCLLKLFSFLQSENWDCLHLYSLPIRLTTKDAFISVTLLFVSGSSYPGR